MTTTTADSPPLSLLYVTVPSEEIAVGLGTRLVEERLVACANVVGPLQSIYEWEGTLQRSQEVLLFLKARSSDVPRVMARAAELHPYECPALVALPIDRAHPPFGLWVAERTERD